jgi:TolA-binding protein
MEELIFLTVWGCEMLSRICSRSIRFCLIIRTPYLACLLFLVACPRAAGQARPATLEVRVSDMSDERPLPQANVQLFVFGQGNFIHQENADGGGRATFIVQGGQYKLTARAIGYEPGSEEVDVGGGDSYSVMIRLRRTEGAAQNRPGGGVSVGAMSIPSDAKKEYDAGMEAIKSDAQASITHFRQAVKLYPAYSQAYTMMAVACLQLKERSDAIDAVNKAIKVDPQFAPARTLRGRMYLEDGDMKSAEQSLQESLRLDPQAWDTHFHLARCLYNTNKAAEALEQAKQANNSPGSSPLTLLLLADIYLKLNQRDDALSSLEAFETADPGSPLVPRVREKIVSLREKR